MNRWWLVLAVLGAVVLGLFSGCKKGGEKKSESPPAKQAQEPTLRIFALGGAAGAIEPCGCVEDMLGGVDHAAALIGKASGVEHLVLGAGPMFFEDPEISAEKKSQALLKARTMADSLNAVGLTAWAPGANDWALGVQTFAELAQASHASPMAANLPEAAGPVTATTVVQRGGVKIGVAGVSIPRHRGAELPFELADPVAALQKARKELKEAGAEMNVALIAAGRGSALRMIEQVPGFQLAVLGKGYDQGEANDEPTAPAVVGQTLVVQAPNHLQAVAQVDLFVRDQSFEFQDGSGLAVDEQRASLDRRIEELRHRLDDWKKKGSGVPKKDVEARARDLAKLTLQRKNLDAPEPPEDGSYFLYDLTLVKEKLGTNEKVASRLLAYYKRVNHMNKAAFADKKPIPAGEGESSFIGIDQCTTCHQEARAFWDQTGHAAAYETLEKGHKEFNLDCVSCHVTGYEKPGGSTVAHVEGLKDVQCEVCHGPGSRHVTNPLDDQLIVRVPERSMCAASCHHPPHVKESWSVNEAWPKIIGKGHGG